MSLEILLSATGIAVGLIGSLCAWLVGDARAKARSEITNERVSAMSTSSAATHSDVQNKLTALEVRLARSEQDSVDIHRSLEKLDTTKASRDSVEPLRAALNQLREDIDRRFDRIESLISAIVHRGDGK